MKLFVREHIMTWVIVCLVAGVVAEMTGPGLGVLRLIALGVAAIAFAMFVWPDRPRHRRHA
jgi:uncharacterized membrane protein YeaQ/YmgE (transglycosylase-associated protein family)